MKDNRPSNSQWALEVSLDGEQACIERGFDNDILIKDNGRAEFRCRLDHDQVSVWLVGKAYGVQSKGEIESWAANFDSRSLSRWATKVDGDWVAIIFDRARNIVNIISDRNGASRVYYSQEKGVVSMASTIWGMIPHTSEPKLSSFSAFSILSTYYTLDPNTLLESAAVSMPGQLIEISSNGVDVNIYFEQVLLAPEYYKDESECVREMDDAFRRVFRKRVTADRTPLVLLSGGIDSVTMVKFLSEECDGPIHTLTFSVDGQARDEHDPARIAAEHFGTKHHELVIDPTQAAALFQQACVEQRTPNLSTMLAIAVENYISNLGGNYDIFYGEDTRLHTPDFDAAKKLSIWLNLTKGRSRFPRSQRILANVLNIWPWYPKNYMRLVASQVEPQAQAKVYFLQHVNKLSVPSKFDLEKSSEFNRLLAELPEFLNDISVSDVFRQNIKLSYRLQYTDNLAVASSTEKIGLTKHSPFYDWELVNVFNRIPFKLGARGVFTIRSWSRFLMVNKKLLRLVLKGAVPKSILYRRKTVASAVDVFVRAGLFNLAEKILNSWYEDYSYAVGAEVAALSDIYVEEFRGGSLNMRVVYAVLSICHMALLTQQCKNAEFDVGVELSLLREENSGLAE